MAANRMLTAVIKRRTISGTASANDQMMISFTDGSKMMIKTAGLTNIGATGGTLEKVRQNGEELDLDLTDGSALTIHMAGSTSSVILRDKAGKLEYAD